MKKTYILGLMAAALGFTACSSEDDATLTQNKHEGIVLKATVEQAIETRATIDNATDSWNFDFSQGDQISVGNEILGEYTHYTFTKGANDFTCSTAKPTSNPVTWHAYFPNAIVYLQNQTGRKEDVANLYALSGTTSSATTGEEGLNIDMHPHVAILAIDNQKGPIDINVKNGPDSWVWGLSSGFNLGTNPEKVSLLTTSTLGLHYIAVPAGVQISIKDGNNVVKSTGTNGLTAGKYYNVTIGPLEGFATANIGGQEIQVKWKQLWYKGPKFAERNIGAASSAQYGGYYCWGGSIDSDDKHNYNEGTVVLTGSDDTATNLWGSNWRMPTKEEFDALLSNCDVVWTDDYNGYSVKGYIFTGRDDYSSVSMFLPAAGYEFNGVYRRDDLCYWSSTPYDGQDSYSLLYNSSTKRTFYYLRNTGFSVRAVLNEQP